MNKIASVLLATTISFLILSCNKTLCESVPKVDNGICIDSSTVDDSTFCMEINDPVCGCDGVTYSNSCFADISGVNSHLAGVCCD
tara:strand:+ start:682 stop:936 length:255 start_codon:yes stop_codon:yes gene_type:complete